MEKDARARLERFLSHAAGCAVRVRDFRPLEGGAIQENWRLDVTVAAGEWKGDHALVLRRDAASRVAASHGRLDEFRLLKAAHEAGVTVPTPCLACDDAGVLGGPFFIMHRLDGEAAGHRLVKRPADEGLARALGQELARIHAIETSASSLKFLEPLEGPSSLAAVARYRRWLDELGESRPALEWALRRLELEAPPESETVLCHRDFRTGNYMVGADGTLAGVLDWEFAGWGEPEEDVAWFSAKCWRFGADDREAGGIAPRAVFVAAYEEASGRTVDPARVAWWEAMAHVRWAVIACQQAARHLSGAEESLELALTAHLVPELELEALRLTGGGP
ncbi:MAG: phosphotransferase family protein [Rhodospirillales bacterium]